MRSFSGVLILVFVFLLRSLQDCLGSCFIFLLISRSANRLTSLPLKTRNLKKKHVR